MTKISDRVRIMIENEGITPSKFSKNLGYDRSQTIHDILNAKSNPSYDFFYKFIKSEYSEIYDLDWLITGEGDFLKPKVQNSQSLAPDEVCQLPDSEGKDTQSKPDVQEKNTKTLPLLPIEAVAGFNGTDSPGIRLLDCAQYEIPEFDAVNAEFLIRVSGSSMYPKYSSGDILACRKVPQITFIQWGKIYVIDSCQGAMVKRIFEIDGEPDFVSCVSDNPKYPAFRLPKSEIRSLSIVVGAIRLE